MKKKRTTIFCSNCKHRVYNMSTHIQTVEHKRNVNGGKNGSNEKTSS